MDLKDSSTTTSARIMTRFLVVSDTHGMEFPPGDKPLMRADVAIHCGDLTDGSQLHEFRTAINLMKDIDAPLKLIIAGNHDFSMDNAAFKDIIADSRLTLESDLVVNTYGVYGDARQLFKEAKDAGVVFLDEGTHTFFLENGALLTVYASPFTPGLGGWGFQYHLERGHDFAIEKGVDVAVSHGPPKGIMDYTHGKRRAGCPDLFTAVARARPQLHCFGHIHEGWGAKLVSWRPEPSENPSHFTEIDNDKSFVIEKLAGLNNSPFDTPEMMKAKSEKLQKYANDRCCTVSHCPKDDSPIEVGAQTVFVNASVTSADGSLSQKAWLVDLELPKQKSS